MLLSDLEVDGQLRVGGTAELKRLKTVAEATATRVCTSADYGKTILLSYAGTVTVTLPANGAPAGSQIDFVVIGANTTVPVIAAATLNTLITPNNKSTADSVTFATANRIAAAVSVVSDGTYWHAHNVNSGLTMTVTTA